MQRQSYFVTALLFASVAAGAAGSAVMLSGCGDSSDGDGPPQMQPPGNPPATTATYYHDIKPLMDRYCVSCHRDGDIAPFTLTDYAGVNSHAPVIPAAVSSGKMPPWMPSDAGMPLRYSRQMRPQDKQLLLDWLAGGAPAGDPSSPPRTDIPPPEEETPPRADLTLKAPQPYMPDTSMTDDYHCFVFDPKNDHDRFLTAGQVNPDNRAVAHHMALFLIPAMYAPQVKALDPSGAGYTCFGGPANNVPSSLVLGWAPGGTSMRTPMGTAFRIPTGSVLVMQMHYNVVAANGKPDQTSVVVELTDTAPAHELVSLLAAKGNIDIMPGAANWKETANLKVSTLESHSGLANGDIVVYAAFPHMHLLGTRIALNVASGPMAIEIPHWDFHWQNNYSFVTPTTLHSTDSLQIECDYDNSFSNQPVINGQRQPPREVRWGESTLDEMCITVLTVAAAN